MATLEQVMQALRNADASGNTKDAQRLAKIAQRMKTQKPAEPENTGAMPFVNRAIAQTMGAPVDLIAGGLNLIPGVDIQDPYMGSKDIERAMGYYGIDTPPEGKGAETIPEHMGQVVGEASSLLIPAAKTTQALSKGAGLTAKVASNIWQSMIKHPYLTMTSELMGAGAAGAARGVAEKQIPGRPGLQTGLEIAAGVGGAAIPTAAVHTPTMMAIRAGRNVLYKLVIPFTKKGGTYRAGEFMKKQVARPELVAQKAGEETIGGLPPAIATGERKIITLYKSLIGQDPATDFEAIEGITNAITKLEGEMRKLGYGSPELLKEITEKRIAALELRMDNRVLSATEKAQAKLDALPVAERKAAESRIVRDELYDAMKAQRAKDKELWDAVDKDFVTSFENTRETYNKWLDNLGKAQLDDVPPSLKKSEITNPGEVDIESTTLKEMQSLRSKLLETARKSRKEGDWTKAKIAQDVADSILDDLDIAAAKASSAAASDLRAAIAATKRFKLRFETGEPAKILGYAKSGAPAIDPDLALKMTVGRLGERGGVDLNKVVVSPKAHQATKRYLGRSFVDYAAPQGKVSPTKADQWIKNNEAILDNYPDLKNQLSDSATSQAFADDVNFRMAERKKALRDPRISTSAEFLNRADMGREISAIFKSGHPSKEASNLVRLAGADASGNALQGIRAGFVEHILDKATVGVFNDAGEQTLSGRAILNFVKNNESTLRVVFDNKQINRIKRIGTELAKIEKFYQAPYGKPDIDMDDWASRILALAGRLGGAELGGRTGGSMGGSLQHAQIISGRVRNFMNGFSKDRAQQLVQDAIMSDNPKLMQSLLNPLAKPKPTKKDIIMLNKNLNLWLMSTGKRVYQDIEREDIYGE